MYSYLLEELSKAIGARLLIQFSYQNEIFIVEPHLLGKNNDDLDCLCAWLIDDKTKANMHDNWRCFFLTEIRNLKLLDRRFNNKRPGYDPYDNNMTRIYYRI